VRRSSTLPAVVATGLLNYDANDRTSTDPYDANGNLLQSGAGGNVYDFENRLVQAGGVALVYDGDGNRVQETVAGVTTSYLVADQNLTGYAQVVDELQGGAVSRTYSYGLSLVSERQTLAGVASTSFYGFDGHGSVRYLTSSTGAVTDAYDFDAFGNLISSTGTTPNNYLFAGEQFDPALGIYYNRARYYDQRQGRFWSMDSAFGRVREPKTLHRYLYTSDNPVSRIDKSGFEDADLATAEVGIAGTQALNATQLAAVEQLVESAAAPEVVALAPQAFGLLARTIAWLSIGTIAFGSYSAATGAGGGVPTDQALAEANTNNYDIYRFGNAQGTAKLRLNDDYDLNSRGMIDPQNPLSETFKGASAYRDPYSDQVRALGLSGVLWRVGFQSVLIADGLSAVADGKDVKPDSSNPVGHHTIFPTIQMTPDDFEQRVRSLPWVRSGRIK